MKGLYLGIIISIFLVFSCNKLNAQRSNGLTVEGKISVQEGSTEGAVIQVYEDGRRLDNYGVGGDGRYKLELNYNHKFELIFERENNFSQKIVVETALPANIKQSDLKYPPFTVNINLFTQIPGIDKSFSEKTVLKIYYSTNVGNFISELYYNDAQIKNLIEQAKIQSKMIGKEADYLSKLSRAERAELRKEYNQLLEQAGKEYSNEEFLAALDGFKAASKIFPEEQFPKDRIAEINDLLGLIMAASELDQATAERFAALIKEADLFFNQTNYSDARNSYNRALSIRPSDSYALAQLNKITELLAQEQADIQYRDIIAQADMSYDQILYTEAKRQYQDALQLRPNEKYPKSRVTEIERMLLKQANNLEKQENYKQAMFQAESFFVRQFYDKALASYENALGYKPGDEAATAKIAEINGVMKGITNRLQFDELVRTGEKAFKKKLYEDALNAYTEANILIPDEQRPKKRIEDINSILQANANFADLVYQADNQFIAKNYLDSKELYEQALKLQKGDKHSQNRIQEIIGLIKSQGIDEQYNALIVQADDFFNAANYDSAKGKYTDAIRVKSKEKYPKDKVAEINSILQQIAKTEQSYKQAIAKADGLFNQKNYENAKAAFTDAGKIKPDETYPPEMIGKIDGLMQEQALLLADQQAAEEARLAAEAEAEKVRLAELAALEAARLAALQADKDKSYTDAITRADNYFQSGEFENARNDYRSALTVKPEESYPQEKIDEIGSLLSQLSASQKAYEDAVSKGDREFKKENFDGAKLAYNQAKQAKSDEAYPDEMIVKVDSIVSARAALVAAAATAEAARLAALQAEKDKNYTDAVGRADNFFNANEYENARKEYRVALTVKPEESYPQEKIDEIGSLLALLSASQKAYEDAVSKGDREFKKENFDGAKLAYNEAKQAKSDEAYPEEMIVKVDSIVSARAALVAAAAAAEAARLAALQAEKDKNYTDAVGRADNFFNANEYENARKEYRVALTVKPEESYPQEKIDEIGSLLAQLSASQKAYEDAVAKGDREFKNENFDAAILAFNEAKQAKSDEAYPDEMIVKVDSIVSARAALVAAAAAAEAARLAALQADKDKNYTDAIGRADNFFSTSEYENARSEYGIALTVKPEESYPQQKINEIDQLLKDMELALKEKDLLDKNYASLIQQADRFFGNASYLEAKEKYKNASELKAEEAYPKEKIIEIDNILEQQKLDEEYRVIVVAADGFFKTEEYVQAKSEYQKALELKSEEQYPKDQIAKIDELAQNEQERLLAEQQAAEDLQRRTEEIALLNKEIEVRDVESEAELISYYNEFIQKADALFNAEQYNVARAWYYQALDVKSDETYPSEQIAEINKLIGNLLLSEVDRDYQKFIDLGDSTFRANELAVARGWYNQALSVKANEAYPKNQIDEIQKRIAERLTGAQFEEHVDKASKAFDAQNYGVARFWYKKALEIRPDDADTIERLNEIADALK